MSAAKEPAIVTGGTSGIGLATARTLAELGHDVLLCGRDPDAVSRTVVDLKGLPGAVEGVVADVTDPDQVEAFVQTAVSAFGHVGVVVNNAGLNGGGVTAELSDELWHAVMAGNLHSVFYVTRAALRLGAVPDGSGRIISIASTAGKQGVLLAAPYSASKHGVVGFTKALGKELAPRGITVNAVCPGYVETPMAERVRQGYAAAWHTSADEVMTQFEAKIPLGRYSTPEEVAGMVAYLASPTAGSVTAQALNVCGGLGNF